MSKSDYLENVLLNWLRGTAAPAAPGTIYLSLHTADPGETGANEHGATAGYVRRAIALSAPPSPVSNTAIITYPQATADYSGPITHLGFWDALTAGNFLGGGALAAARTIRNGDTLQWAIGAVTWTED